MPEDLLADLRWRRTFALCQVDQEFVGGVCEVQMPLALQLAVKAVLSGHSKGSTEVTLARSTGGVNRI
jgi:hypothetical protein